MRQGHCEIMEEQAQWDLMADNMAAPGVLANHLIRARVPPKEIPEQLFHLRSMTARFDPEVAVGEYCFHPVRDNKEMDLKSLNRIVECCIPEGYRSKLTYSEHPLAGRLLMFWTYTP